MYINNFYPENMAIEDRNWLLDRLVNMMISTIRNIIKNGFAIVGIPPLDPLKIDNLHLDIPVELIK